MPARSSATMHPLIRKLEGIGHVSEVVREAVVGLPVQFLDVNAKQDVVREGDRTTRCFALVDGFACSFKVTGEGKRQITAFYIAGDMPDLQSLHLNVLDAGVSTLTRCTVAFVKHEDLWALCTQLPSVTSLFWRATLIDAAIFREWTTNVGQRNAVARIAHVLCEFAVRLRAIGDEDANIFNLPVTQTELADATGMSTVHTNRSLQELRAMKLITWQRTTLTIPDLAALAAVGDFDQTYLHLRPRQKLN
jgi:CRP-like cAMP-binding protein